MKNIYKFFLYQTVLIVVLTEPLFAAQQATIPERVRFKVAYIPQNDSKSCATTSVAMAISYYKHLKDKPLDKETVWQISNSDENMIYRYGNDMKGLERIVKYYGYRGKYVDYMKLGDLEGMLAKGILVVLNIKVQADSSATHAVLVTGYDKSKKILYINDPAHSGNKSIKYSDLKARWAAHLSFPRGMSYRSGFIIYPKRLP